MDPDAGFVLTSMELHELTPVRIYHPSLQFKDQVLLNFFFPSKKLKDLILQRLMHVGEICPGAERPAQDQKCHIRSILFLYKGLTWYLDF